MRTESNRKNYPLILFYQGFKFRLSNLMTFHFFTSNIKQRRTENIPNNFLQKKITAAKKIAQPIRPLPIQN